METKSKCLLECAIGISELIQSSDKEPLESRLEKDDVKLLIREKLEKNYNLKFAKKEKDESTDQTNQSQNEKPSRDVFVAGQNCATDSIVEFVKFLLKRDYRHIFDFDGLNDGRVGVNTVPETHIPRKPRVVAPENAEEVLKEHKDRYPKDTKLAVSFYQF